jgi:hypothetical protein
MQLLTAQDLAQIGIKPDAALHQLSEVQVRKIIRVCASKGAVRFTVHASLVRGVERKISNDMVIECLKRGGIRRGSETSKGGGISLRLAHIKAGVQYQVEVAIDQIVGPAIIVTVIG